MERNFKNEDFEQFLRQSADGLRMRPSEKVWKGISGSLNRRRKRFGFFLGVSLLATSALGYYLIEPAVNAKDNKIATNTTSNSTNSKNATADNTSIIRPAVPAGLNNATGNQFQFLSTL